MGKEVNKDFILSSLSSSKERSIRDDFHQKFLQCPIPPDELLANLDLFVKRQDISHLLFMHELYQRILPIHGVIIEFGVRWGRNMSLFSSFRGMYEPFNYTRKIIGFDTFAGFPSVSKKDGDQEHVAVGAFGVSQDYEKYLDSVLAYHESESPMNHIKKYELIKGDATVTLEKYLQKHPETIIAMAYFDFDIYEPTKKCLELIAPHLTKGSVLGFDELNHPNFPGETLALKEVLGLASIQYAVPLWHQPPRILLLNSSFCLKLVQLQVE